MKGEWSVILVQVLDIDVVNDPEKPTAMREGEHLSGERRGRENRPECAEFVTQCLRCGLEMQLTTASRLQAKRRGVLCHCAKCGHEWIFHGSALPPSLERSSSGNGH